MDGENLPREDNAAVANPRALPDPVCDDAGVEYGVTGMTLRIRRDNDIVRRSRILFDKTGDSGDNIVRSHAQFSQVVEFHFVNHWDWSSLFCHRCHLYKFGFYLSTLGLYYS